MGRHSHTLARTHSQHSLTLIHSHTRKWHAFISLHDNCERTDAGTDGQIPRASRFLWPAESNPPHPPPPARFPSRSLPDLHFNWFLSSSALKSLANVFAEHVFYANISGNARRRRGGRTRREHELRSPLTHCKYLLSTIFEI